MYQLRIDNDIHSQPHNFTSNQLAQQLPTSCNNLAPVTSSQLNDQGVFDAQVLHIRVLLLLEARISACCAVQKLGYSQKEQWRWFLQSHFPEWFFPSLVMLQIQNMCHSKVTPVHCWLCSDSKHLPQQNKIYGCVVLAVL